MPFNQIEMFNIIIFVIKLALKRINYLNHFLNDQHTLFLQVTQVKKKTTKKTHTV